MTIRQLAAVTGASSGIGQALAGALAAKGMDLIVIARRKERLDELQRTLQGSFGISVRTIEADLSDAASLASVEDVIAANPVDLLVNCAGFGTYADFASISAQRIRNEATLDLIVPMVLTRAALPAMLQRRRGTIINVSSMAGFLPIPKHATYCAAKAGLTRFTEALAGELANTGIRVQAVCPGPVATEFFGISGYKIEDVPAAMLQPLQECVAAVLAAMQTDKVVYIPSFVIRTFVRAISFLPASSKSKVLGGGPAWFRQRNVIPPRRWFRSGS